MDTKRPYTTALERQPGSPQAIVEPPPGYSAVPRYDQGWLLPDGERKPFLSYVAADPSVNWSGQLEALHEESSRTHFIDRWTRGALVQFIGRLPPGATIADVGCSTGFLLADLHAAHPHVNLIGIDLITSGLRKAHLQLPSALLLHADACALPIADASLDAVVSANLLEHIPDDGSALLEIARVLRPGGRAAIAVPAGPRTYDYYDRFLGHERRYGRGELAAKCAQAGLEPLQDLHIASLIYPAFWLIKQLNRRRYGGLTGDVLVQRVARDIGRTQDSRIGHVSWQLETMLAHLGVRLPFGVRSLVLAQKPGAQP